MQHQRSVIDVLEQIKTIVPIFEAKYIAGLDDDAGDTDEGTEQIKVKVRDLCRQVIDTCQVWGSAYT